MDDHTLHDLLAERAIRGRLHDYVRAMDRIDDELGYSVFHPDASADYGAIYQGTGHGFVAFVHEVHLQLMAHAHHLGSISVFVDGDRAASEAYVTVWARRQTEDGSLADMRTHGRYLDQWEHRNGQWRIIARQLVVDFDDCWPVTQPLSEASGRRDRSDPSYALFQGHSPG